jgi:SAM-dependent methyltransferase
MTEQIHGDGEGTSLHGISCPVCQSQDLRPFLELLNLPAQDGVAWPTREQALAAPAGNVRLLFCSNCSYIWNTLYDGSLAEFTHYDFSLHYSPLYQDFVQSLVKSLIDRHDIRGKTVLEIGCGQGDFLRAICRLGHNQGVGIDPSYTPHSHAQDSNPAIVFHRDYFSSRYTDIAADFIICRHVVDELEDQAGFLRNVRPVLEKRSGSIAYFEVPNPLFTFANGIIWNVGYAKHAWLTATAFSYLLGSCGFRVLSTYNTHGEEYVSVEAAAGSSRTHVDGAQRERVEQTWKAIKEFQKNADAAVTSWAEKLEAIKARRLRLVAWGAGQRAVNFLNRFDLRDEVAFVVDINAQRQGMFLARTGHRVEPPERLLEYRPDIILITNPTYSAEIRAQTHALGIYPDFLEL